MNSDAISVEWRPSRGAFWLGLAWSLIGATMCVVFIACYMHPEWSTEDPISLFTLIVIEMVCFVFTILGLLVLWNGLVGRLRIDNERIEKIGPMERQSIQLGEVEAIDPGTQTRRPNNRIILTGHGKRFFIHLGIFPPEVRGKIVGVLRQKLKNLPSSEWEKYNLEVSRHEQLVARQRLRARRPLPNSDRLLLIGSLIVFVLNEIFPISPNIATTYSQFHRSIVMISMMYVFFGAPIVFLTSLWELIRHRRTWRTMAALLISGVAIYLVIEPFYNVAYRVLRH